MMIGAMMSPQNNPTKREIVRRPAVLSSGPPLQHGMVYPFGISPTSYPMQCGGSCGKGVQAPASGPLYEFVAKSMTLYTNGTKIEIP